jgi:hypothetical protein
VSSPQREPHRQLVNAKINFSGTVGGSQASVRKFHNSRMATHPRHHHLHLRGPTREPNSSGTPQIEAAPQTATQTSFPATDDVVSQISDGLLEKLSPAIMSSIETLVR